MPPIQSFRDLDVWRVAMDLVTQVYVVTRQLPREEFDLRRQLRRAAISIAANVAEGWQRNSRPAYRNHVSIALGSHAELETELEVAVRTALLEPQKLQEVSELNRRVGQMLIRLHQQLSRK